jgi:hypothetical protein
MNSEDWLASFVRDGYACFRGLCPEPVVRTARAAIDADLAANYDPGRQIEYDHRSYCPDLRGTPPIMALLLDSGIPDRLNEAMGFDRLGYDGGQIALRQAHNGKRELPPEAHIDGLPSPHNGVPADILVSNFTVLAGIFLSSVRQKFAGNFTVWPRSHHVLEVHFREYGPEALRGGMPQIPLALRCN